MDGLSKICNRRCIPFLFPDDTSVGNVEMSCDVGTSIETCVGLWKDTERPRELSRYSRDFEEISVLGIGAFGKQNRTCHFFRAVALILSNICRMCYKMQIPTLWRSQNR